MFSITGKNENGFDKIILKDETNGTQAVIIPACGAMLFAFTVLKNGEPVNLIENYHDLEDFKNNLEAKGFRSSKLSPYVCRMKNGEYQFAGAKYKTEKFYMGDHAIHGLLYDATFSITDEAANEGHATLTMLYQYNATDKGYPFKYDCKVTYKLMPGNSLTINTEIINTDKANIPITDGWHPYFTFGNSINDLQLEFQSKEMLEFDEDLVPTGQLVPYQAFGSLQAIGETFLDNCFTVNFADPITIGCQPMLVLRNPSLHLQLEIYPGKSYPYLQIYTPPHRQSIAIENLSAAPDSFNNGMGLVTLAANEQVVFSTTYKIAAIDKTM